MTNQCSKSLPWEKQTRTASLSAATLSSLSLLISACPAKHRLKPAAYAKGSYLVFLIRHERPLRRRSESKWNQALITLRGEYLKFFLLHLIESFVLLSVSQLNLVPVVGVDRIVSTTAFAAEAYTSSPAGLPISVPMPNQLGSASGRGLGTTATVSVMLRLRLSLLIAVI